MFVFQAPLLYELEWKLEISMKPFSSVLTTVSMDLFDQLVIVTCDPVMEG